ncbi:MAG: CPBP family glutamic-type intramembrane protease [Bacteroidia bacterium]
MTNTFAGGEKQPFVLIIGQCFLYAGITITSLFVFAITGSLFASLIFNLPFDAFMGIDYDNISMQMVQALKVVQLFSPVLAFLVSAWLISRIHSGKPWRFMGADKYAAPWLYFVVGGLWLAFYPLLAWMIEVNQQMQLPQSFSAIEEWMQKSEISLEKLTEKLLAGSGVGTFLSNVLIIAVAPAISEELFFRGTIQRLFRHWTLNPHIAIFVAGFLFSFIHFQFYGFLPRMAMGVLFGYLLYWSGSIWVPVFAHFLNNFLAVLGIYLYNNGIIDINIEEEESFPWWLTLISVFSTVIILFLIYQKLKTKNKSSLYVSEKGLEGNLEIKPEEKEPNWIKIYSVNQVYEAEILVGALENEGIKAIVVNKKDSSYQFGDAEIYCHEEDADKALGIIRNNIL